MPDNNRLRVIDVPTPTPALALWADSSPLYFETELQKLVGCEAAKEALRCTRDGLEVKPSPAACA